jgi:tetratricopeptide (TPR) repeat protein
MAGCIFRVIQVVSGDLFSIVRMELCSNEENDLKSLFESMRSEYGGKLAGKENEADMNSFGTVLFNMDKFDMANIFFRRIYYETSPNDPNRARYYMNSGNVALHTERYKECARWYDRSLELYEINGLMDHPLVGSLYFVRGNLYTPMNKRRQALDSYNKALSIFQANFGENYPMIALCYNSMARHFERRNYFRIAIEYRERTLKIAEKTLPPTHPDLVLYHLNISILLLILRHPDVQQALHHAQITLRIANTALPPDHPIILQIYETLREIYKLMRDI